MIKLYGVPGWGSAISEVMLTLGRHPVSVLSTWTGLTSPALQRELLLKLNPLCQVPTLEAGKRGDLRRKPRRSP